MSNNFKKPRHLSCNDLVHKNSSFEDINEDKYNLNDEVIIVGEIESSEKECDISNNDSSSPRSISFERNYSCKTILPLNNISEIKKVYTQDIEIEDNSNKKEQDKRIVVEKSPKGRFHRFNIILGSGAEKCVYLAYDSDNGREVAWNAMNVCSITEESMKKIQGQITILKIVRHPNIISFIYGFYNEEKKEIVIITELFSGGSLSHHLNTYKNPRLRVIKKWCTEILNGLKYLHELDPPIIHRDIKCDNILINKYTSQVGIGDLGFSTIMKSCGYAKTFSGTAEFCSPEVYQGKYGVKADIYSFGLCMLEMVTHEKPYKECNGNLMALCDKATKGIKPQSINKIRNKELLNFILLCLKPENERPMASELLKMKFLNDLTSEENDYPALNYPPIEDKNNINLRLSKRSPKANESSNQKFFYSPVLASKQNSASKGNVGLTGNEAISVSLIEEDKKNDNKAKIVLKKKTKGKLLKIQFDFHFKDDTIAGVVDELQKVMILSKCEQKDICGKLKNILEPIKEERMKEMEVKENYLHFDEGYNKCIKEAKEMLNNFKCLNKDLKPGEVEEFEKKICLLEEFIKTNN